MTISLIETSTQNPRCAAQGTHGKWLDSPVTPALVMFLASLGFVAAHLVSVGQRNIGVFVVAGRQWVDPSRSPQGLPVMHGSGYDGQFYYRFAIDPIHLSLASFHGISLDFPYRQMRVGYSAIVWLFSLGQLRWIATAMVLVNVIALAAGGLFGGLLAQHHGRHAMWGLLPAAFSGLVYTLSRDLTEIVASALLLGGILAIHRGHPGLAGLAWSIGVLTRETVLIVAVAALLTRPWRSLRGPVRPAWTDVTWLAPLVTWSGWELCCRLRYGALPALSDHGNLGLPLTAFTPAFDQWLSNITERNSGLIVSQLAVVLVIATLAIIYFRRTEALIFERVSLVIAVLMAASLTSMVWNNDPVEFRTLIDVHIFASTVLLGSRAKLLIPLALTLGMWIATAALRATVI